MKSRVFRIGFLVATPLVLAVVLWFHPNADADTVYESLRDDVTAMLVIHVTMGVFLAFFTAWGVSVGLVTGFLTGPIGLVCFAAAVGLLEHARSRGGAAHTTDPAPLVG
jgi:hypothetical protein